MQTEHLSITGMTCGGCTTKITRALKAIPGVEEVTVSLSLGDATIQYDEKQTSIEQLKLAINTAGYGVGKGEVVKKSGGKGGCCG